MKKHVLFLLAGVVIVTLACGLGLPTPPAQVGGVETIVSSTLQALTPALPTDAPVQDTPTTEAAQPSGIAVSFRNVAFVIPNGLAVDANSEVVPAANGDDTAPWDFAPEYIQFTFNGYHSSPGKFSVMHLRVYPAQDYVAANEVVGRNIQALQAIASNPSAPLTEDALPGVPYFNAAQMFAAQVQRVNFQSGSGVRMVTQYGQAAGPATNSGTFYHFQGLTSDGKYYLIAVLPIGSPLLISGEDPNAPVPAGGVPFPGYEISDYTVFNQYYRDVTNILNAASPDTFQPPLTQLDALIQSITINPQ
jgi:hypothetical protein